MYSHYCNAILNSAHYCVHLYSYLMAERPFVLCLSSRSALSSSSLSLSIKCLALSTSPSSSAVSYRHTDIHTTYKHKYIKPSQKGSSHLFSKQPALCHGIVAWILLESLLLLNDLGNKVGSSNEN